MRKSKYSHINPNDVRSFYLNHNARETAKQFGFANVGSLEKYLAKNNIVKTKENSSSRLYTQHFEITLSEADQQKIVGMYQDKENSAGIQRIAILMKVTKQEVRNILDKFNVPQKYRVLTPEQYEWAKSEYLSKPISTKELARQLMVDPRILYDFFQKEGIQRQTIFTYNDDFFEVIDTEEKAYWLGFLSADGYIDVPDNKLVLETSYKDVKHLECLIENLCPLKEYKKKRIKKFGKEYDAAFVYFNSPKICNDLIKMGCTGKKTFNLRFPKKLLNPELLRHFVRGYFDGDGSVHPIKKRKGVYVEYCGNKEFLTALQSYLEKTVEYYKKVKLIPKGQAYTFRKAGNYVSEILYKYMYSNATIYLKRKYNIFLNAYGKIV